MKQIAKTLRSILDNPVVAQALDRSQPVDGLVEEVQSEWRADLVDRKPAPAYIRGTDGEALYSGTDLDLFTVMVALGDRNAVINIPRYENMRATTLRSDQHVVSKNNRHGQVLGLTSHRNVHSFSTRIKDYNVVQSKPDGKEEVGAYRNFALVGVDGQLHNGWDVIEFKATPEEKKFFEERKLYTVPGTIVVHNFVHPNLANAMYGSPSLSHRALSNRLDDEASFYRGLAGKLRGQGIILSEEMGSGSGKPIFTEKGESESVPVRNIEVLLKMPEFQGSYALRGKDEAGKVVEYEQMPTRKASQEKVLRYAAERANALTYSLAPQVRALTRAVDLAFFLHGGIGGGEIKPSWDVPDWKDTKIKRTEYRALDLGNGVELMYRERTTSTPVGTGL